MEEDFDFDGVFDDDYLYFYADRLDEEHSEQDTAFIAGLLGLEPRMRVLDVPCGHGRIANRLAVRGAEVVGVDSNPLFLERARQDAAARGVEVDFLQGDMRDLPGLGRDDVGRDGDGRFDAVVNWFTSFGYFDDATDRSILSGFRRALRSGGRLVMDLLNRDLLLLSQGRAWSGAVFVVEQGDDLMIDRVHLDAAATRSHTERIVVRGGRVRRTRFSVRLFTLSELRGWLRDAGFGEVEAYTGSGTPFTWGADRLVVLAIA
ncbi:MAG: class I SAM-dependent methyltransferase [Nitriliruptorales bacterium]